MKCTLIDFGQQFTEDSRSLRLQNPGKTQVKNRSQYNSCEYGYNVDWNFFTRKKFGNGPPAMKRQFFSQYFIFSVSNKKKTKKGKIEFSLLEGYFPKFLQRKIFSM